MEILTDVLSWLAEAEEPTLAGARKSGAPSDRI
jgi:hypothetical protein